MSDHAAGIRAVIRLGQAETTNHSPGRQFREEPLFLLLGPITMDGVHHETALNADKGS